MLAKSTTQSLPFALANCTGMKCNGLATNEDDKIVTEHNMQTKQCFTKSKYYLERAGLRHGCGNLSGYAWKPNDTCSKRFEIWG